TACWCNRSTVRLVGRVVFLRVNMEMTVKSQNGDNAWWSWNTRIAQRIITTICILLLCIYLVYGEHAQVACNALATVPAALFTYGLLLKTPSETITQKAIILYWSVHGLLICFDNAFGDLFGYFLAKFVLLFTLLVYAIQKSTVIVQFRQAAVTFISGAESTGKIANRSSSGSLITMRSTIASFPRNERSMMTALSATSLVTPMKTITKSDGRSTTKTIYDLINEDFKAGDHKYISAGGSSIISAVTADASTCIEQSKFEPSSALNEQGDQVRLDKRYFDSLNEMHHNRGDYLIITPSEKIIFKPPFIDSTTITITNASNKPVMWALKTNALKRLAAQPTCGVLPSYATVHLKIGLLESPPSNMLSVDRMAIDYCITEEGTALFDRGFMHRKDNDRRRKNIPVSYFN
uniref:Major sperm protein n=1 Tax=Parascaris univalens TaxID=6257 RepID=A0A915B6W8_PARUN